MSKGLVVRIMEQRTTDFEGQKASYTQLLGRLNRNPELLSNFLLKEGLTPRQIHHIVLRLGIDIFP